MKLVVSFYGMCLCVLDRRSGNRARSATVLLLNGAAPATEAPRPRLPYHHPLLFVPAKQADLPRTSWSPVPAAETLVDTENLVSGKAYAWSLSGLDLTLGRGRGIAMYENQTAGADGLLPDPANPDDPRAWHDWRRIPDLARMAPGARLRTAYTKIGQRVLGIIRFSGGELRGATPKNRAGAAAPWQFTDTYSQIITDRFEFHCELPGSVVRATGYAGGKRQALALKAGARPVHLTIVHEASVADMALHRAIKAAQPARARKAAERELPHYKAFFDAIEGKGVSALPAPRLGRARNPRGRLPVIDTPDCPPALI